MRKAKNNEYIPSKIRPIVQVVARMVAQDPTLAEDQERLWANTIASIPELKDKSKCVCGQSLKISLYEADLHDALLIYAMAKVVKHNLTKGMNFTEANKVHIPTLEATNATIKRQTKCDYLGLIKQNPNWKGTGYWCLTRWAWQALRGEPIHRAVKYWEGQLLGRSIAMITLDEMFKNHKDLVELAIAKRKAVKADYRAKFEDYDRSEWVDYGEVQQGVLV